jgi:hypothetical protein
MNRNNQQTASAAVLAVGAELSRRGYDITFTLGNTRKVDMLCAVPDGKQFSVQVKGVSTANAFRIDKSFFDPPVQDALFLIVVLVPKDDHSNFSFFVLSHAEAQSEYEKLPKQKRDGTDFVPGNEGLYWSSVEGYKDAWSKLPSSTPAK